MSNNSSASASATASASFPIFGLLGVVFVTLKLLGIIDWSWWWVTAPFWLPLTLVLVIGALALLVWAAIKAFDK